MRRTSTIVNKREHGEDVRARSDQQKMHQQGIFRAIKEGRKEEVARLANKDPSVLIHHDAVGATPLHIAFLYRRTEIGKMLMTNYPELATSVYAEGEYSGENILHIAVVHQDYELVCWLIEREPELLNAETTGSFFLPSKDAYFGGYPLLFAVASNQREFVQAMLATRNTDRGRIRGPRALKNQITVADRFGNGALHLCVIHDLPEMYDFVVEEMRRHGLTPADIRHRLNAEKLTPLALAAAMGHREMFQHILGKNSIIAWDYGPVTCKLFPLGGLEQPIVDPDTQLPVKTAIQCLCAGPREVITRCLRPENNMVPKETEDARLDLVACEEVRQILDNKWDGFGQTIFNRKLGLALAHMGAWTATTIVPTSYAADMDHLARYPFQNCAILCTEVALLAHAVWRLLPGLKALLDHRHTASAGAAMVEARLGDLFCGLFIMTALLRIEGSPYWSDVVGSTAALVGWFHVFFFLLGYRTTGPFVIMIKEMIQQDVRRFFSVYGVVLLGYTSALYLIMLESTGRGATAFVRHARQLILLGLIGDFPFEEYTDPVTGAKLAIVAGLVTSYILLVVILLLNLLIAMMGNTYSDVEEQAEKRWYVERANLMAAYEAEFTTEQMQQLRNKYATPFGMSDLLVTSDTEFCLTTMLNSESWKLGRRASKAPRASVVG